MPQNTPNYSSNIHFGPPGYPGGASGAQNLKIAVPGGYLKDRIWVLWNFCPIFGHLTLFWWSNLKILTLVVYHTPLSLIAFFFSLNKIQYCRISYLKFLSF